MIYSHGYTACELQKMLSKRHLPDFIDKKALSRQLIRIIELSADGLRVRGFGEEKFLKPLYERAEKNTNPAKEMLSGISKYIERYSVI